MMMMYVVAVITGPHSPTARQLLAHLASAGLAGYQNCRQVWPGVWVVGQLQVGCWVWAFWAGGRMNWVGRGEIDRRQERAGRGSCIIV